MRFTSGEYGRIRRALVGPDGDALVQFMYNRGATPKAPELADLALSLGLFEENGELTETGYCVSASCREYSLWQGRNKRLPFEEDAEWLNPSYFSGRKVVEIGCGMGVNLMSLQGHADCVGIEPFEIYKQMGKILREKDSFPEPKIRIAGGENVPLDDKSADVVICVTAHQYFDVIAVFSEISRILKSDGELFIVGWTFPEYLASLLRSKLTPSEAKKAIVTLTNTVSYSLSGRRVFPAHPDRNTSRPIYPTAARIRRWMESVDIEPDPIRVRLGKDCFQRGEKRRASQTSSRATPLLQKEST